MTSPAGRAAGQTLEPAEIRVAPVGSPNSGKTTLFNALTGLRAKTGNYPGVTVSRYEGTAQVDGRRVVVEDLPGSYSLDPISPDEQVLTDVLDPLHTGAPTPSWSPSTPRRCRARSVSSRTYCRPTSQYASSSPSPTS